MHDILNLLRSAVEQAASDIFIISGLPVSFKINGKITAQSGEVILPPASGEIIGEIYRLAGRDIAVLTDTGDDDFSMSVSGLSRFRVCAYKQRGSLAAVIRTVNFNIPKYTDLNINQEVIKTVCSAKKGLVLITGPAGSGKTTTLACIIDELNNTRSGHIITLEDPIEYIHKNKNCVISQREIKSDTEDYISALRACLRQSPDIILIGEMRDYETIKYAMTAAETGHLVISTLHTIGAVNTIDRIIDVFPANQQPQIRLQLSMLLQSVISQQLVPTISGGIIPAFEIMHANGAIRNLIRECKVHQTDTVIQSCAKEGMIGMDTYLYNLCQRNIIDTETALTCAANPDGMRKKPGMQR